MKVIAIGVGGTGAACIEVLVHLTALGLLREGTELIPVTVDPDQQHPRIQGASRFIAAHNKLSALHGNGTDGILAARIARVVNTNALRPSEKENLFSLIGLHYPPAESLAHAFFHRDELGAPKTREFANGFYGHVNAGVCFFNDPTGRKNLIKALRQYLIGNDKQGTDAVVVLLGSAFGGTGAAGLVHLARVFREDETLKNVNIPIAAIQLEPYFKPDRPATMSRDAAFVNLSETFEGRTGAAYQFLRGLAEGEHVPFNAFYPLGVRVAAGFPQDWFKRDQQDNPHLFIEYVAALAVRDFAINHSDLDEVVRHRREAVPSYSGPLNELRQALYRSSVLRHLLSRYVIPLLEGTIGETLPGHPWMADLTRARGVQRVALTEHFKAARDLLSEIVLAAGIDRDLAVQRAGEAQVPVEDALRKNELTRASFPVDFAVRAENLDLKAALSSGDVSTLFADYDVIRDGGLFVRSLYRWVENVAHAPAVENYTGALYHQWIQQEDSSGSNADVLGITVPSDDEFRSDSLASVLSRLSDAKWKRPSGSRRTASEYPSVWAPALVHRDELFADGCDNERRYLQLGLLASILLERSHLAVPPVKRIPLADLDEAFSASVTSTFPLQLGQDELIAPGGPLVIYESDRPLVEDVPRAADVVGFFFPDTVVVPAPGISPQNRELLEALGYFAAGRGFAALMANTLRRDWVRTLQKCGVPGAADRGTQFIQFLDSFTDPLVEASLSLDNRFEAFPVPDAADWIHRLYR
jgi:hypothetical protein